MNKTSLLALCLLLGAQTAGAGSVVPDAHYDDLVRKARSGDTAPALEYLRQHVKEQTRQQQEDHIVIASWAGRDSEVLEAYAHVQDKSALSAPILASVARAYRNTRDYERAAQLYRQAEKIAPDDPQWVMGEMLVMADGKRGRDAIARGRPWLGKVSSRDEAHLRTVMAYAWLSVGERFEALHEVRQAFLLEHPGPFDRDVLERYGQVLSRAELPMAGLEVDARLTPVQRLQKQADEMALQVRMSHTGGRQEADRFVAPDELISRYHSLLSQCDRTPGAEGVARQMRIDRMGAYEARGMHRQVVAEYEQLSREGRIPSYAEAWVAQAYMALHNPGKADELFRDVIAHESPKDDHWTEDNQNHVRSLLEDDRPGDARQAMDALLPTIPKVHWSINYPLPQVNENWLSTQLLDVDVMQANGDERKAFAKSRHLCEIAPAQTSPCIGYGALLEEQGRYRDAEYQYLVVQSGMPRNQSLEVAQLVNALNLREWHRADVLAEGLTQRFTDEEGSRQALRQNEIAHMAEFQLSASKGHSHSHGSNGSNGNPIRGNDDLHIEGTLYSPRFGDHWRAFLGADYTSGDFGSSEKGSDRNTDHGRWQRGGVEYTDRNTVATLEASTQRFGDVGQQMGGKVTVDRDINDRWHYGAAYSFRSAETPLRARAEGIWANQGDVHASWTPSNRTSVQLSLSPWHFSDGNWRWQSSLSGSQRLWTWPHARLDGLLAISGSRNSQTHIGHDDDVTPDRTGTDYYSPKSDLSIMPGLRLTHALYRHYDRQWEHYLELGAGRYYENYTWCESSSECRTRHDNTPLWMARYGQDIQLSDVLNVGASAQVTRQSYDGVSERDIQLMLDMNYRF